MNSFRPAKQFRKGDWLGLTLGVALIYLAFLPPGIYSVDGNAMLAVSESLVTHRGFTVPESLGTPGLGGQIYSHWYPLLSILAVPFVYAALLASHLSGFPFHYLAALFVLPMMCALTAATSGMVARLATQLGASKRGAWLSGLSFAFGTVALAYGRTFYAEPLLAVLSVASLSFSFGSRRDILLGACCTALAVLAKPTGVIVGPVLAVYFFSKHRKLTSVLPLVGTFLGTAVYAGYNMMRFGHPFNFGIGQSPFTIKYLIFGAPGLLFSPGYGLVWYCPPVILAMVGFSKAMKAHRAECFAIAGMLAGFLVLHSCLPTWYAGWSWGPRYLVPAIPGLCALLGLLEGPWRKGVLLLTLMGFVANAPTLFCFYERYYAELNEKHILTDDTMAWSVRYAPVLHEWPAAVRQVREATKTDVREIFKQRGTPSSTIEASRALRIVAVWWWVLPLARIPRALGAIISFLMIVAACWVLARSFRSACAFA